MPGLTLVNPPPFVARKLEACNDVEMNPGPKTTNNQPVSPTKKKLPSVSSSAAVNENRDLMPVHDLPRVKKLGKKKLDPPTNLLSAKYSGSLPRNFCSLCAKSRSALSSIDKLNFMHLMKSAKKVCKSHMSHNYKIAIRHATLKS